MSTDSDKKSLSAKVLAWLEQQGYPLEMAVAQAFQKANFSVTQSDYYIDPDSGQTREIDVTAERNYDFENPASFVFEYICCVECKSSKAKPWVVFSSRSNRKPTYHLLELPQYVNENANLKIPLELDISAKTRACQLFNANASHGVTQALTSGHDVTFQAATGVYKAATAARMQSKKTNAAYPDDRLFCIIFPIIVIEGPLFDCLIDDKGSVVVNEIQKGILQWKMNDPHGRHDYIIITTLSYLETVIHQIKEVADAICESIIATVIQAP